MATVVTMATMSLINVTAADAGTEPAPPSYAVHVLPVPFVDSVDMSGRGSIAGVVGGIQDPDTGKPFIWTRSDGFTFLETPADDPIFLTVVGVNDNDWVLGRGRSRTTAAIQPFIWRPSGDGYELLELGHAPGSADSQPVDIDNRNRVVGASREYPGAPVSTPFLWTEELGMQRMTDLGYLDASPQALSPNGWVATATAAYRLGDPSDVSDLPALPAPYGSPVTFKIVNDADRVVEAGRRVGVDYYVNMFRLDEATRTWTRLWENDLPYRLPYGMTDINGRGDVVGYRTFTGEVSWAPGELVVPLTSRIAGGYTGSPGDPYRGLHVEKGLGIAGDRAVAGTALFGNNAGRLVRLEPTEPCTGSACIRVSELALEATNPSQCLPGAVARARAKVTVVDQSGAPVAKARVAASFFSADSAEAVSDRANAHGVIRLRAELGACEGTVSVLIESVAKPGLQLDRTVGTLLRTVLPSVRPLP